MRFPALVLSALVLVLSASVVQAQEQQVPDQQVPEQLEQNPCSMPGSSTSLSLLSRSIPIRCSRKCSWPRPIRSRVVQADRFAKANKSLKGDKLTAALDKQDWDASVKQLVSTPSRACHDER